MAYMTELACHCSHSIQESTGFQWAYMNQVILSKSVNDPKESSTIQQP